MDDLEIVLGILDQIHFVSLGFRIQGLGLKVTPHMFPKPQTKYVEHPQIVMYLYKHMCIHTHIDTTYAPIYIYIHIHV